MIERKAKFIGVCNKNPRDRHAWEHTEFIYEYRGHQYLVTKHNNGYAFDSLVSQHRREQERIDREIEEANKPIPEWTYEGSAQQAFDYWCDWLLNQEE